jgi:hypothetical protein
MNPEQLQWKNMPPEQLKSILFYTRDWLLPRVSDHLIEQLRYGLITDAVHSEKIIHEMESLERDETQSNMKPASEYTHAVLAGYWKKHFYHPSSLAKMVMQRLGLNGKNARGLRKIQSEVFAETSDPWQRSMLFANRAVRETYDLKKSSRCMTGEWIIFKKFGDKNYYLTLAYHTESDEIIRDRIEANCREQFPFLFDDQSGSQLPKPPSADETGVSR